MLAQAIPQRLPPCAIRASAAMQLSEALRRRESLFVRASLRASLHLASSTSRPRLSSVATWPLVVVAVALCSLGATRCMTGGAREPQGSRAVCTGGRQAGSKLSRGGLCGAYAVATHRYLAEGRGCSTCLLPMLVWSRTMASCHSCPSLFFGARASKLTAYETKSTGR